MGEVLAISPDEAVNPIDQLAARSLLCRCCKVWAAWTCGACRSPDGSARANALATPSGKPRMQPTAQALVKWA